MPLLTYPLTVIGTRLQMEQQQQQQLQQQQQQSNRQGTPKSDTEEAISLAQQILKKEGIAGFYQGLGSALFGMSVSNGIYYFYYEFARDLLASGLSADGQKQLSTARGLFAGTLAGTATAILTNPIWVVNTHLIAAAKSGQPATITSVLKSMLFTQNDTTLKSTDPLHVWIKRVTRLSKALFQGLGPALVLVMNPTIQYGAFEQLRAWLSWVRPLTHFDFFLLGALSKLLATLVTYPYIILKTRLQLRSSSSSSSTKDSMTFLLQKIIKEDGIKGLYKGLSSKAVQSVLTAAILFYAKESLFQFTIRLIQGQRPVSRIVKAY